MEKLKLTSRTGWSGAQFISAIAYVMAIVGSFAVSQSTHALEGITRPAFEGATIIDSSLLKDPPILNTQTAFDINVVFAGGLTPSQQAIFAQAEATWESIIKSHKDPVSILGPTISASGVAIDGPGGILGQAGPTNGVAAGGGSYLYASAGVMQFDTADLAVLEGSGLLDEVILHEMGHVLGIGTIWSSSGVGVPGFQELYVNNSGQYTGVFGLAAYNSEFGQAGAFVPVELGGGPGTANGHWNEVDGGAAATGIVSNITGQDLALELMTGWLNPPSAFISTLTMQSMMDLGYNVVPEPGTFGLAGLGVGALLAYRWRVG